MFNKNLTRVKNSNTFAAESKEWTILPDEIQVSYGVVNLYPYVPIRKVIMHMVKDD